MSGLNIYIFFITYLLDLSRANEVVGCGGFLKSHVPIDFSKVEVRLVTKQGIIKDKTTAAPNNGYYFVPLYDKGEMFVELAPPPGWSFEPKEVAINIDGVNDFCSQGKDINFVFQGFGITGKVESLGDSNNGPKGVTVHLQSKDENRTTITNDEGSFFFTPVYPGVYKVSIYHPKWKIFKKSVDVQVEESNAELQKDSLIVQGYEVTGKVTSDGEPVKGVTVIILLSEEKKKPVLVDGCIKEAIGKYQGNNSTLCHAITDDNGVYRFGVVPNGRYFVTAHFEKQNIHYQPQKIEFAVNNGDAVLEQQFEIIGFSIPGRVYKSKDKPVPNAKIYINGQTVATTDKNGIYKLEKLKAGTYKIKVEAEDLIFDEKIFRLNPSHQELPDILPSAFKVCGMVTSGQSQTVSFMHVGTLKRTQAQSSTQDGGFCQFLAPGKYDVKVVVGQDETQKGLQFFPLKHTIEVVSDEITDLIFSQLKATVFGKVKCLQSENCQGLSVVMKSDNADDLIAKVQGGSFKFEDIFPGTYKISLSPNRFCWETSEHVMNINSATVDVSFTQTGYIVNFLFSHDAKVRYQLKGETKSSGIAVTKGRSSVCLPKPGEYKFTVESCHSYSPSSFTYTTDEEVNEIALNAEKHTQTLCIAAETNFGDVRVAVKVGADQTAKTLKYKDGCYKLELMLEPGQTAAVEPHSDFLFFTPGTLSVQGKDDCSDSGMKFSAAKGKVFRGKVVPALEGVVITVETPQFDPLVVETDAEGFYKFQPLDNKKEYKISAAKESYVLMGPDENGNFAAHKLAEVHVEVVDSADNTPLTVRIKKLNSHSERG
ncbi:unnamed protein product [Acanthoscelides obtectus]|uniref:Nodal modulator 1 n=1 Tax=Acanthoscelides obtectus TaxID=200917 RepID=A0A9P0M826_ACAOB|nr:unnamed protein product [Acanthoscelides obtectus]CAK1659467.1 Nodal modulator 1 [Acanthoscelides obtectus]